MCTMLGVIALVLVTVGVAAARGSGLGVYSPVPGLDPSPYYAVRAREAGGEWRETFVLLTECTPEKGAFRYCN